MHRTSQAARNLGMIIAVGAVIDLKSKPVTRSTPVSSRPSATAAASDTPAPAPDLEILAARFELDAGRRRSHQTHAVAPLIDFLMHMPPQHGAHLWKTVQHSKQRLGIAQPIGSIQAQPIDTG
jgi:hypothetical protein